MVFVKSHDYCDASVRSKSIRAILRFNQKFNLIFLLLTPEQLGSSGLRNLSCGAGGNIWVGCT